MEAAERMVEGMADVTSYIGGYHNSKRVPYYHLRLRDIYSLTLGGKDK